MPSEEPAPIRAYTKGLRAVTAGLEAVAVLNLLELAVRIALDALASGASERAPLPQVVRRVFFLSALPWLVHLVGRALAAATLVADDAKAVVGARWGTIEVPRAAIAAIRRWRVPLPEPGFDLVMRSGSVGLSWAAAPALGAAEFPDAVARHRVRALHAPWFKLFLVPAALTFILFRLHQRIAFGDLFGEAQALGWRRWLRTLSGVALSSFCLLLIAAAALRAAVELIALATSRLPPRPASRSRIALEVTAAVLYYGGLAAVLLLRLGL